VPRAILYAVCLVLVIAGTASAQTAPPPGLRFPSEADRSLAWSAFADEVPEPWHATADFDGNGLPDIAWILLSDMGTEWSLCVFLNRNGGQSDVVELDSGRGPAQFYGIAVAVPDEYLTACGKGYWPCATDEPPQLDLSLPALNFYVFESANAFFWWNSEVSRFEQTWMSD